MRSRLVRGLGLFSLSALAIGSLSACGETTDPTSELGVQQQAIFFGTRTPSITNLSLGEEMAIGYLADSSGSPFCTATLIDRDVAITAQHCVVDTVAVDEMRFGMGDPNSPEALIEVHSAPFHPDRDVALLFLKQDAVSLVPSAEPIPFVRENPEQLGWEGGQVEAAGYGATHDDSTGRYYVSVHLEEIQEDWLVVNGYGERGICFGDSGGPLMAHVGDGEPVIAGVESHGDQSCVDQDFETRLDKAAEWIDSQIGAFDPNSEPQTGTQGDGECGGTYGLTRSSKCGMGLPMCSASATTSTAELWIGTLGLGALILAWRRRMSRS